MNCRGWKPGARSGIPFEMFHIAVTQLLATENFIFLLKFIALQWGLWKVTFQGGQCSQARRHSRWSCYAAGWLEANAVPNIKQYLLACNALSDKTVIHEGGVARAVVYFA